ncbi:MAG TPA: hypothetical protein VKU36_00840 [Candidatus Babeliales bacterium]|nr:hypothetical protein [Candidatus Babeliales bacterium]
MNFLEKLLKKSNAALLLVLLAAFGCVEAKQLKSAAGQAALQEVQQVQEKRDAVDNRPLDVVAETKTDRFTQTEAHLYLPKMRDLINKEYKDEVIPYLNIISAIVANEAEHKDTHYAFYNTTPNMWRLAQDLYTRLDAYAKQSGAEGAAGAEGFKYLRFGIEGVSTTAQEFLINELKQNGLVDDNVETVKTLMLSVNLALFANVGLPGECSWNYFVKPQGHKSPDRGFYEEMLDKFGLTHKYIGELMALAKIYDTDEDTILQLLVPIDKVDDIGYLAWVKGIPAHSETIDWILKNSKTKFFKHTKPTIEKLTEIFAKQKLDNPLYAKMMKDIQSGEFSLGSFLKIYRNTPWKIEEINDVTARLLFTRDVLLNPKSGVKVYRFSTASREKLREYNSKLSALVEKLIEDKESSADSETKPQPSQPAK